GSAIHPAESCQAAARLAPAGRRAAWRGHRGGQRFEPDRARLPAADGPGRGVAVVGRAARACWGGRSLPGMSPASDAAPRLSVVLEFETAGLAAASQVHDNLDELRRQVVALGVPAEIV